jgi:hypothetical protein
MRTRRATLILSAVATLLLAPAVTRGLAGGSTKTIFETVKWGKLTTVTPVVGPSTNDLFIVSDGTTTVIAKFSNDVPLTINFADQFLKGRGIPVPNSLSLPVTDNRAKEPRKAILAKVQASARANGATTLSLFEPVTSPGGLGTVGHVLVAFEKQDPEFEAIKQVVSDNKFANLTSAQRTRLNKHLADVRELARCLGDADQAKLLGQHYELDAFLGNGDRLHRLATAGGNLPPNWRNLMLGTVGNPVAGFVAIDNHVFAPSLEELAWVDNRKEAFDALANKTVGTEWPKKVTVNGRKEWVNRLVHGQKVDQKFAGITDEHNLSCCDLDVALQYAAQSKAIVDPLRTKLHKLLFTDMTNLAQAVTPQTRPLPAGEFPDYKTGKVAASSPPGQDAKLWTFTVASVSDQNTLSYYAFEIDWDKVQAKIAEGMKSEVDSLTLLLPRSKVDGQSPSFILDEFKNCDLIKKAHTQAIRLSPPFPDTVAAEALFVRLAYLALRPRDPTRLPSDVQVQNRVLMAFGSKADKKVDCSLVYVAGPKGASPRRKPR